MKKKWGQEDFGARPADRKMALSYLAGTVSRGGSDDKTLLERLKNLRNLNYKTESIAFCNARFAAHAFEIERDMHEAFTNSEIWKYHK